MAVNGNEIENPVGEDTHGANSYFEAFAGIVAALDALAKAVTPDADDDGTPPDEIPPPSCNSGAKCDALRVSMVFTWKPDHTRSEERELIIRGYVSDKRQMAVCCCLHTKGDGIRAGFDMGGLGAANKEASQFTPQSSVHRL